MPLNDKHLEDLRRSGLSDETIASLGFYSANEDEVKKILNRSTGLGPGMVIPYPMFSGFASVKLDVAPPGEKHRYRHTYGSTNHIYIPPLAQKVKDDPATPIMITEGEKKAAKACQEGIPCIAVSGVWNWKSRVKKGTPDEESLPLPDFDLILLKGRRVPIVFDSDSITKEDVHSAGIALQEYMESKKESDATITFLPSATKNKIGLDDYLISNSVEDLMKLVNTPVILPKIFRNFEITKIEKMCADPPLYHVYVNGRDVTLNIEEFTKFSTFETKVAATINFFVSIAKPVTENWKEYKNAILRSERFEEKEAPREADDDSSVEDVLREFLGSATDDEDDFGKGGKALIRGNEILVHGKGMKDYVLRHIKNLRPRNMWDVAEKKLGAKRDKRYINKVIKTKDVWIFPISIMPADVVEEVSDGETVTAETLELTGGLVESVKDVVVNKGNDDVPESF